MSEHQQTICNMLGRYMSSIVCICLLGGLGCAGKGDSKASVQKPSTVASRVVSTLPMPEQLTTDSATTTTTNQIDSARAVMSPPKPKTMTLYWNASTNGWAIEVSRTQSITSPLKPFRWVTNATQCEVPIDGFCGFYAITKMVDLDNSQNVWIAK